MEDATRLDVVLLACSLLVFSLDKGLATVALTEGYLAGEGADGDRKRDVGLEEGVARGMRNDFGGTGVRWCGGTRYA